MIDAGYQIIESVLSSVECDALIDCLHDVGQRGRAGARHLMANNAVRGVAQDARLTSLASAVLGGPASPYRATLFEKSGRANWLAVWHQDTALPLTSYTPMADWGPWSTKAGVLYAHAPAWALEQILALRVHLDASVSANGPLRVVPGSHRSGVLTDPEIHRISRCSEASECLVNRGGVVVMRPLLIHSSSKVQADLPRRVLHIEYAIDLDLADGVRLVVT